MVDGEQRNVSKPRRSEKRRSSLRLQTTALSLREVADTSEDVLENMIPARGARSGRGHSLVEGDLAGARSGLINRERLRALGSDPPALRSNSLSLRKEIVGNHV